MNCVMIMCRWRYGKRHRHWWHTTSVRWVHIIAVVAHQSHLPSAANLTNTRRRNDGGIIVRTMTRKTTARTVTMWCSGASGACWGAEIAKLCDRSHLCDLVCWSQLQTVHWNGCVAPWTDGVQMNRQLCTFGAMTGRSLLARCHGIQLPWDTGFLWN
jgi:hypothetical protein